jgi:pre-mRNA-processing factor 40
LQTAVELEFEKTPWKEYETGGRKYWVNAEGGETTWDMPLVLKRTSLCSFPGTTRMRI